MFVTDNINVPVLGLVENMAWFTPAELPENRYYLFGKKAGRSMQKRLGYRYSDRYLSFRNL
jgi:ATP-binding protein involved in chromosome partitioning